MAPHDRSYTHMSEDELVFRIRNIDLRRRLLSRNPFSNIREHGLGGLDEAAYVLNHIFERSSETRKLGKQEEALHDELARRDKSYEVAGTAEARRVVETPDNAATFYTLNKRINKLRDERIARMRHEGEVLYLNEIGGFIRQSAHTVSEGISNAVGGVYDLAADYLPVTLTLGCFALSGASYVESRDKQQVYDQAVAVYEWSNPFGRLPLELKRGFAEEVDDVQTQLTSEEDDDGDVIQHSDPKGARQRILGMHAGLENRLGDQKVIAMRNVLRGDEPRELLGYRNQAQGKLDFAASVLEGEWRTDVTYHTAKDLLDDANESVQLAASVFERQIDSAVKDRESNAYFWLRFYQGLTFGFLALGMGLVKGMLDDGRERRYYS